MITAARAPQIHPFPARMAPELALEALGRAPTGSRVLDPMCGSGTVLKHAVEEGHHGIGFDFDPMAVLLSRVACRRVSAERAWNAALALVDDVSRFSNVDLPWIDSDPEAQAFIDFWFDSPQRIQLRQLAWGLRGRRGPVADLLRVAMSRTIVTKDRGASRARDVSHSRPHRVRDSNDYDVFDGFLSAVKQIGRVVDRATPGSSSVIRGDARRLPKRLSGTIDLVITSPPYLNAIDYMRGHRMSLIWLGHTPAELRHVRSTSIGAERTPDRVSAIAKLLVPPKLGLSRRDQGMLDRYANDMHAFMTRVAQTLTPKGQAVVVVGDSTIRGTFIENSLIVERAAALARLQVIEKKSRPLPAGSRYLPPPTNDEGPLSKRMRSEVVFRFKRGAGTA